MRVYVNDQPKMLPVTVENIADLLEHLSIKTAGTAVAVNGKIVRRENWPVSNLNEEDKIMIISAAYGG